MFLNSTVGAIIVSLRYVFIFGSTLAREYLQQLKIIENKVSKKNKLILRLILPLLYSNFVE